VSWAIGFDPGLENLGIAIAVMADPADQRWIFTQVKVHRTSPDSSIGKMADTARRVAAHAREASWWLANMQAKLFGKPLAICVETAVFPPRGAQKMIIHGLGRVAGMLDGLAVAYGVPLWERSPQEVKRAICGESGADKADVRRFLELEHPELRELWPKGALVEHASDAAAVLRCWVASTAGGRLSSGVVRCS
jgi:Holliday junction resolvasome RuvABC endonuclease subunit